MAGIRKLKGKYYIRVWVDRREVLLPTGTGNKRDAEIQLRKIQQQELEIKQRIIEGFEFTPLSIADAVQAFESNIKNERNIQDSTLSSYRLALNDLLSAFRPALPITALKKTDYSKLLAFLQGRYNSTTVNIRLRGIRTFLNYLLEKELIRELPFKVKQIKTEKPLPKFITPEDLEAIYREISDPILLSSYRVYESTGMRLEELHHSTRDGNYITVTRSKSGQARIIPISDELIPVYDLATREPYSVSWISRNFSKFAKAAGLEQKVTVHSLRHTYALRKLMDTDNIQIVRDLLGHSSVKVTEIYTRFPKDYLKQIFTRKDSTATGHAPALIQASA